MLMFLLKNLARKGLTHYLSEIHPVLDSPKSSNGFVTWQGSHSSTTASLKQNSNGTVMSYDLVISP